MEFKCKTCGNILNITSDEAVVECSKCGRKHNTADLYTEKQEILKKKKIEYQNLNNEIEKIKSRVSSADINIKQGQEYAKYAIISLIGEALFFLIILVSVNQSEAIMTIGSLLFTGSIVIATIMLSKIQKLGLFDKSYEDWNIANWACLLIIFLPFGVGIGVYESIKILKLIHSEYANNLNANTSEQINRINKLQVEIENLETELSLRGM